MLNVCCFRITHVGTLTYAQTVPRGVRLTPDIEPYHVKPINITLNIDQDDMEIGGYIRYLDKARNRPAPADLQ